MWKIKPKRLGSINLKVTPFNASRLSRKWSLVCILGKLQDWYSKEWLKNQMYLVLLWISYRSLSYSGILLIFASHIVILITDWYLLWSFFGRLVSYDCYEMLKSMWYAYTKSDILLYCCFPVFHFVLLLTMSWSLLDTALASLSSFLYFLFILEDMYNYAETVWLKDITWLAECYKQPVRLLLIHTTRWINRDSNNLSISCWKMFLISC